MPRRLSLAEAHPLWQIIRDSYIYQKANQTVPINIVVKQQADFEILNASGTLSAGAKKSPISATYKNIGEDPIRDAVARLSIFKPFSSTDDQAFIGTLQPGESRLWSSGWM